MLWVYGHYKYVYSYSAGIDFRKDFRKEPRRQVKIYLRRVFSPTTIAGASQHSFNTCLRCTLYRGCRPTHQIPVQCWASVTVHCRFNAGLSSTTLAHATLIYDWVCCILCANTCHSTNAVSMLTHSFRR